MIKLLERHRPPVQKESSASVFHGLNFSYCKLLSQVINDPAKLELLCEHIICHHLLGSKFPQCLYFFLYMPNFS